MSVTIPTTLWHLPTLLGKENKLWSSSLSTIPYPHMTFFLLGPNTFFSNTFTNILNLQIQGNNPHINCFKALSKRPMQRTKYPVKYCYLMGFLPASLTFSGCTMYTHIMLNRQSSVKFNWKGFSLKIGTVNATAGWWTWVSISRICSQEQFILTGECQLTGPKFLPV
jgi:hypothetical protein